MARTKPRINQITGVKRNDIGTVTTIGNLAIVSGWHYILGNGTQRITKTVSFGVTFASAPIVITQLSGVLSFSNPTSIAQLTSQNMSTAVHLYSGHVAITTTNFVEEIVSNVNLSADNRYGFSFIAIGELA